MASIPLYSYIATWRFFLKLERNVCEIMRVSGEFRALEEGWCEGRGHNGRRRERRRKGMEGGRERKREDNYSPNCISQILVLFDRSVDASYESIVLSELLYLMIGYNSVMKVTLGEG